MKLQLCLPHMHFSGGNVLIYLVLMGSLRKKSKCQVAPKTGPVLAFVCDNGKFVVFDKVCDGTNDCGDGSDEEKCTEGCLRGAFYCNDTQTCFPPSAKCDGVKNCPNGSDELNCPSGVSVTTVVLMVLLIVILAVLYLYGHGFVRYVRRHNQKSHSQFNYAKLPKLFKDYNSHITCQKRMLIVRVDEESEYTPLQGIWTYRDKDETIIAHQVANIAATNFENANPTGELEDENTEAITTAGNFENPDHTGQVVKGITKAITAAGNFEHPCPAGKLEDCTTDVVTAAENFKNPNPADELGDGTYGVRHRQGFISEERRETFEHEITPQEFIDAVTSSGYPCPTNLDEQCNYFIEALGRAGITTRIEAAMFLAQLLHESYGLTRRREIGGPSRDYHLRDWNPDVPIPGQLYYGRGYIQLTYASNYSAASKWLGYGDLLLRNPDLVARREDLAWDVSSYFWVKEVQPKVESGNLQFGRTTRAINGVVESKEANENEDQSWYRFWIYQRVFKAFGCPGEPD